MAHSRTTRNNVHRRFWSKVAGMPTEGCWEWIGTRSPLGYGAFWLPAGIVLNHGRMHAAHRVAYYLTTGEWPGDLDVCHSCDNPPCVRPGHLWVGTVADNARDRSLKGRTSRKGAPRGEANPGCKVTDAQVVEIIARARAGERHADLAQEFGISIALVSSYRNGRRRTYAQETDNLVQMPQQA